MKIRVLPDAVAVANEGARLIASLARNVVMHRGRFVMALSGGTTPWQMLGVLGKENVPWTSVHIFQVDERVAPPGHQDRNLTHLYESLLAHAPVSRENIHAMPVESENLASAAKQYATLISKIAGTPPVLDLVHLGLGPDGHTASLIPGDPVLQVKDSDVGITGVYQGRKRMTLTYPIINRARNILWLVTGVEKAVMLKRMWNTDSSIPAGLIGQDNAYVLADEDAFSELMPKKNNKGNRRPGNWEYF